MVLFIPMFSSHSQVESTQPRLTRKNRGCQKIRSLEADVPTTLRVTIVILGFNMLMLLASVNWQPQNNEHHLECTTSCNQYCSIFLGAFHDFLWCCFFFPARWSKHVKTDSCCRFGSVEPYGFGLTKSKLKRAAPAMASRIWSLLYSIASWQPQKIDQEKTRKKTMSGWWETVYWGLFDAHFKGFSPFSPINRHFGGHSAFRVLRQSHLKGDTMYNMRAGRRSWASINRGAKSSNLTDPI